MSHCRAQIAAILRILPFLIAAATIVFALFSADSSALAQQGENESSPLTGELPTDDPPANFRVTGFGNDYVGLAWEVPDGHGISSYVLQRYRHDGSEFISSGGVGRFEGRRTAVPVMD